MCNQLRYCGVGLFVLLIGVHPVAAQAVTDQQQPVVDVSVGGFFIGGNSEQKLAQVITVGISGEVTEVRFPVACAAGSLVLEIQRVTSGVPNGVVLASETVWGANFPPTSAFKPVVVSQRPFLVAGETIALVLSSTGDCGMYQGPVGDSYGGGDGFYDSRPNLPGWVFLSGGRRDLPFQSLVEPRPVANADVYTAGFGTPLSMTAPGVLANDAGNGGGTLSAVLVAGPAHGSVALGAAGAFTFTPATGYSGVDTFTYRTTNALGPSNVALVSITVAAPSAPVAVDDAFTTAFATALEVPPPGVLGNDSSPVGAPMMTVIESGVTHGALVLQPDGGFSYTPDAGYAGTDWFMYRASNAGGASHVASVALTVSDTTVVQPPAELYASSIVGNTVTLRFRAPATGPQPTGYVLRGGLLPNEELRSLPTGSTFPIYAFTAPTGVFYLRMHALNGEEVSAASNEIRIFVGIPEPPTAPADLTAVVQGTSVALSWRNTYGGGAPEQALLDVSGPFTGTLRLGPGETFAATGVAPGIYILRLRSANATDVSAASTPVTVTVPGPCSGVPLEPSRFLAYRILDRVFVVWEPPTSGPAATAYLVNVEGAVTEAFPVIGRTLNGVVGPGDYWLSARAINPCGSGPSTPAQLVTVP